MDKVSYSNLSPNSFLERSALIYPEKPAVVYQDKSYTYAEFYERVNRLAGSLKQVGVKSGDRVAFLVPNLPAMLEGHYGPLRVGAILVAINIRLSSREIAYILNHSQAKILVFDSELAPVIRSIKDQIPSVTEFIQVVDTVPIADDIPSREYESFLDESPPGNHFTDLANEIDTISLNYTSGTTGSPKGVEYHARGAYLNALAVAIGTGLTSESVYLWTLPMFHCNGWCFTWGVTAVGATHICMRRVDPPGIYGLIRDRNVTHLCCAPTILTSMYSAPQARVEDLSGVNIVTGGAVPAPQVIRKIENMGARLDHAYGLTETFGPHTMCIEQPHWDKLTLEQRNEIKARQGVPYVNSGPMLRIVDEKMMDVPKDGMTVGEVVMRGNNVMSGYFNDAQGTAEVFRGGWFHSGDLAVWHADGYIELKDRIKDVIISGGENISSQEVEKVIMEHPAVLEVSVIGVSDDKWGEVPKAFVVLQDGIKVTENEIIQFTRERLAHFKCPKYVEFGELPKTATGKIQKFRLRELGI